MVARATWVPDNLRNGVAEGGPQASLPNPICSTERRKNMLALYALLHVEEATAIQAITNTQVG